MRHWGRRRRHVYYTTPLVIWALAIVFASLAPPSRLPPGLSFDFGDKVEHAIAYLVFGLLLSRGYFRATLPSLPKMVVIFLLAGLWGYYLEALQGMTDYRTMDLWDALANIVGALLGCTAWYVFKWRYDPHRMEPPV